MGLSFLVDLLRGAQQAAGGEDVLAARGAYGGEHPVLCEVVAELFHLFLARSVQVDVGDGVEADEVDAAFHAVQQLYDAAGVVHRVVHPSEDDIFEGEPALVREVVVAQQVDDLLQRHAFLCRHQAGALLMDRGVHADRHVALALVEEAAELVFQSHGADGDAFRAPCVSVVGGEDLRGLEHVVEVVHRLALTHEDDVGQAVALGQAVHLVQDVRHGQVALKALLARLAEEAVHLAAHLARHAERTAVTVRDEHGLDKLLLGRFRLFRSRPGGLYGKQIFGGAVDGVLAVNRSGAAHLVLLGEQLAVMFGEIGHLVDRPDMLGVDPLGDLTAGEGRHPQTLRQLAQFVEGHS